MYTADSSKRNPSPPWRPDQNPNNRKSSIPKNLYGSPSKKISPWRQHELSKRNTSPWRFQNSKYY